MMNLRRMGIAASLVMATACSGGGGGGGSYFSTYPSEQRLPATQETLDRIDANLAAFSIPGLGCDHLTPLNSSDGGEVGDPVPGGYRTSCNLDAEGDLSETYKLHFRTEGTELTVVCKVRASLKVTRCDEVLAEALK